MRKRARKDFPFLSEALKSRQPPWDPDDPTKIALTEWQALEWTLLTMSNKDFSAWLATLPPDILGSQPWQTGDAVTDDWSREVAESLAGGGDGIPDSWKTQEAAWQDQKIQRLLHASNLMPHSSKLLFPKSPK